MANEIVKIYSKAPRYTSYPTAVQFTNAITPENHVKWLKEIPIDKECSLYVHIPYCEKLCWFCGCNMKITNNLDKINLITESIIKEIKMLHRTLGLKLRVSNIHFGGGSPNILSPKEFTSIIEELNNSFIFTNNIEIAVESDPRILTEDKIKNYSENLVNRISLGVQDFTPKVQQAINRVQPYDMVAKVFNQIKNNNINNINFDLMYGLPHQTKKEIEYTINKTMQLRPQRIAFFGYAHVPWIKKHMSIIQDTDLPDSENRFHMYKFGEKKLIDNNYISVGIDHFVEKNDEMSFAIQNKTLNRNFQGYTTDTSRTLIGIGPSSISKFENGYSQNDTNIKNYNLSIKLGNYSTIKGIQINENDKFIKEIIDNIMCYQRVNLLDICIKHNKDTNYIKYALRKLSIFIDNNIIRIEDNEIIINPELKQFSRIVCSTFDTYFNIEKNRHSKAI